MWQRSATRILFKWFGDTNKPASQVVSAHRWDFSTSQQHKHKILPWIWQNRKQIWNLRKKEIRLLPAYFGLIHCTLPSSQVVKSSHGGSLHYESLPFVLHVGWWNIGQTKNSFLKDLLKYFLLLLLLKMVPTVLCGSYHIDIFFPNVHFSGEVGFSYLMIYKVGDEWRLSPAHDWVGWSPNVFSMPPPLLGGMRGWQT